MASENAASSTPSASNDALNRTPGSSAPSTPGGTRKSNAPRCNAENCSDRAVKIVGDCRYCSSKFCARHRLPEAHACPNIQSCRADAQTILEKKLLTEKCVASKVQ
ncbi:hypothetical protein BJ742DRAFT_888196 [Cladochytrium replicatum]|nr:hypothetical protein BJ742DRAFT_888196 [Cladochytrium replicatum]